MGGKAKQSQRTKNNVRPSSSGRSAELLNNVIKTEHVFGSLGSGKSLPGLFPTMAAGGLELLMSNEYTLAFKKMNKKDPITRTKALHELLELVNNSEVEDVVAALPSWAHFYLMLTIDSERKVREATQACHGAIVGKCGRRVGPHVRRLLPAWLLAQHDEYAPAQALANAHLNATFPDHKLADAITFCKSDIMSLIINNLTGNAEAILNKKIDDPDDRKLQVSRIISSSLRALETFAWRLAREHDEWMRGELQPLFAKGFWKLASHESHHIRAAWFAAVARIIERFQGSLGAALGPLASCLVSAPERRAGVAAARWAALLLLMHRVEDWHVWLKKKDLLVKRLIDTIENGGWGDAGLLSGVLLPLLRKLPDELLTRDFHLTFFNAFFTGLELKSILNSKSERQAWITNLAECLRYLSIQKHDFVIEIVAHVHRTWLEKIFALQDDTTKDHLIKISANKMAALVKFWIKQATDTTDDIYDKLTRNFWQNFGVVVVTQIENVPMVDEDISKLIHLHTLLTKALKAKSEGKKSIRFEDDVTENTQATPEPTLTFEYDRNVLEAFEHSLKEFVSKTCSAYFEYAEKKQMSRSIFTSLLSVIIDFESEELFLGIARSYNTSTLFLLYDRVLRGWLASDTMRCKALAEIVFMMSKYFTDEELESMYNSFQHLSPIAVEWCISLSLSHPHRSRVGGARWLRGEVVEQALIALCKRADDEAERLLLMCLAQDNGESPVSARTAQAVVGHVSRALRSATGGGAARVRFGAALCRSVAGAHAHDLLLALFLLSLSLSPKEPDTEELEEEQEEQQDKELPSISPEHWTEILQAWHEALCALAQTDRQAVRDKAVHEIHKKLEDNNNTLDISTIEHVTSLCPYLVDLDDTTRDNSELIQTTKQLLDIHITDPETAVLTYALRKDCIYGKLNCPIDDGDIYLKKVLEIADSNSAKDLEARDVTAYVNKVVFCACLLKELVSKSKDVEGWCLFNEESFRGQLTDMLHDFTVVGSLCEGYAFMPFYEILKQTHDYLDSVIGNIILTISEENNKHIINILIDRSHKTGYYWAFTNMMYKKRVDMSVDNTLKEPFESSNSADETDKQTDSSESSVSTSELNTLMLDKIVEGNGYFHSVQAKNETTHDKMFAQYLAVVCNWYLSQTSGLRSQQFARQVSASLATQSLDPVMDDYYKNDEKMFNDRDYSREPWSVISCHAALLQLLGSKVRAGGWELSAHEWDFINIVLCSVLGSLAGSLRTGCTKTATIARPALRLLTCAAQFVRGVRAASEHRQPPPHVAELPHEWRDIFAPEAFSHVLALLVHVTRSVEESTNLTICQVAVLEALTAAIQEVTWDHIPGPLKLKEYSLDNLSALSFDVLHRDTHHGYKFLAYYVLKMIAKPLVLDDVDKLTQLSERREREGDNDDDETISLSLARYYDALRDTHGRLAEPLEDDRVHVSRAFGFLLEALAALSQSLLARGDLVHHYINSLSDSGVISPIMDISVRLLPAAVLRVAAADTGDLPADAAARFTEDPVLKLQDPAAACTLSAVSCRTLFTCVRAAAGAARSHWSSLGVRDAAVLTRVVELAVAQHMIDEQLRHLREHADDLEDAEVQVVRGAGSSGEVTLLCNTRVEERTVELCIVLGASHPLAPPRAVPPPALPFAAQTHWLRVYLAYQNGWVVNAFKMWTEVLRSRVQASPQCYICYCRLHPACGKLPNVPCRACNNRFHSQCLRKWFQSSKKSKCPLCRTVF